MALRRRPKEEKRARTCHHIQYHKEFALLEFLMRHPNEVFSPEALLDRVWKSDSDSSPDTVYTYIKTLRKKIAQGKQPSIIKTVHGVGYKLELPK